MPSDANTPSLALGTKSPANAGLSSALLLLSISLFPGWVVPATAQTPKALQAQPALRVNPTDKQKYIWVRPGAFEMGCSPKDDECYTNEQAHRVTLTQGFWIGQTEVTVRAYKSFTKATGRQMAAPPWFTPTWSVDALENDPIVNVTWEQGAAYCGWAGGRLPTESEWEYAARGGTSESRYGVLDEIAWNGNNSGIIKIDSAATWQFAKSQTTQASAVPYVYVQLLRKLDALPHEVAQKHPNAFGLYDMLGNASEWVADWYDDKYEDSPASDPTGPKSGKFRILRGGSWATFPRGVRVSARFQSDPETWSGDSNGFRCVGDGAMFSKQADLALAHPDPSQKTREYVWIPSGTFEMGCVPGDADCGADEKPRHVVRIPRGFLIGQTAVTVREYRRFVTAARRSMPDAPKFDPDWQLANHPIVNVSWDEAVQFCGWAGGRLPTEAEWEYAARGGRTGLKYPWGNEIDRQSASYGTDQPAPVGSFPANGYGLYDMAGNVAEWILDFDSFKPGVAAVTDAREWAIATSHLFRGGSFRNPALALRISIRGAGMPVARDYIGFRCLRGVP